MKNILIIGIALILLVNIYLILFSQNIELVSYTYENTIGKFFNTELGGTLGVIIVSMLFAFVVLKLTTGDD